MTKIIATFHSTHDAIAAERLCLQNGFLCQAVPLPRELSAECGIALDVKEQDAEAVKTLFEGARIAAVFHLLD